MDLFNPPPRNSLSLGQRVWRAALVTVTLVTLCVIGALVVSLGCFAWQRGRELMESTSQFRDGITILVASVLMNAACIFALLQIKKLDRKMVPPSPTDSARSAG